MKSQRNKVIGWLPVLSVFIICLIHFWGLFKQDIDNPAIIQDPGDYYLVYYYILENCLVEFIFALSLLMKILQGKVVCIWTKLILWLYTVVTTLNLLYVVVGWNYQVYLKLFNYTFYITIVCLILLYTIKRCKDFFQRSSAT